MDAAATTPSASLPLSIEAQLREENQRLRAELAKKEDENRALARVGNERVIRAMLRLRMTVARLPVPTSSRVQRSTRKLAAFLSKALEPDEIEVVIAYIARIANDVNIGAHAEIAATISERAEILRAHDDLLVSAAELADVAAEIRERSQEMREAG